MIKLFIGLVTAPAVGHWFDLDDYDVDTLQAAVTELHGDNEAIISDSEGLAVGEHESLENCILWNDELNDYNDADAIIAYIKLNGLGCIQESIDNFEDAYFGRYDSHAEFAEEYFSNTGGGEPIPDWIVVDWAATWDANLRHDYNEQDGYYFCNI